MSEIIADIFDIIEQGRMAAYASVSQVMIDTYWRIGRRIVEVVRSYRIIASGRLVLLNGN